MSESAWLQGGPADSSAVTGNRERASARRTTASRTRVRHRGRQRLRRQPRHRRTPATTCLIRPGSVCRRLPRSEPPGDAHGSGELLRETSSSAAFRAGEGVMQFDPCSPQRLLPLSSPCLRREPGAALRGVRIRSRCTSVAVDTAAQPRQDRWTAWPTPSLLRTCPSRDLEKAKGILPSRLLLSRPVSSAASLGEWARRGGFS
jgi:hypothetical protein